MSDVDVWDELKKEIKSFGLTGREKSPEHHFDLSVTLTGFYWKKLETAILAERERCKIIALDFAEGEGAETFQMAMTIATAIGNQKNE